MQKIEIYMDNWGYLEQDMSFSDYIWFMRDLKTKAFLTLWNRTINKMHILNVNTDLSPIVSMSVSNFIHQQKEKVNGGYDWREIAYNKWCDTISFNNNKKNDN